MECLNDLSSVFLFAQSLGIVSARPMRFESRGSSAGVRLVYVTEMP